ncbi:MBL fold metallo-hydrolase [Thalassotalea insulae]|uniref:MBL fold metallo-hydrolase n=1 Tax=Thalassotalea insulae TaxID=2056778 RepID=UPI0024E052A0|nr:MBL fold metallo-hydrolase [Thalassotalea insulae]
MRPKRFHQSPIDIEQLPDISVVIISHEHYDHLDKNSIKQLIAKVDHFVTPLKVGDYLTKWGVEASRVTELNWWQEVTIDDIKIVATPAQHFSGRGVFDKDQTLWASWVIQGNESNLFYSGDSGYFSGFKTIGDKYGPFDVTMIETGAYNRLWSDIHMLPEQSLQAHIDLQGKAMLPVHNSTFDLALHDWFEPLERISDLAWEHSVKLVTPIFGKKVSINQPNSKHKWWRTLMPERQLNLITTGTEY